MNQTAVIKLVVDGGAAEKALDRFEKGLDDTGRAADRSASAVDRAAAKIRASMEAQALGLPKLKARADTVSREERAWQSLAAKTDPIMGTRIRQERELNRAVVAATNAAVSGYATQEQALRSLMVLEEQHEQQLRDMAQVGVGRRGFDRGAVRQNLMYQYADVGVSLAGGMPLHMVALQQGSQIIGGPGGLNAALAETGNLAKMAVTRFGPLGAAIGAGAAAIEGLRRHIQDTTGVAVSFGDTATAVFQVIGDGIMSALSPALNWVSDVFGNLWNAIAPPLKTAGNGIIGVFVGAYEATKQAWGNLPTFFSAMGKMAWNNLIAEFEKPAVTWGDQVIIPGLNLNALKAGLTDAELDSFNTASVTVGDAMSRDYLGEFGSAVTDQAIENYRAGLEAVEGAAGKATDAAAKLGDTLKEAARAAKAEWDFYRSTFSGFFSDLKSGLRDGKGLWESFGSAAANALDKIADRFLGMAADGLFNMLFGVFMPGGGTWGVPGGFAGFKGIFGVPGFANGTGYAPGGLAWVGERGPELVNLPRGSQVYPAGQSRQMMGGEIYVRSEITVQNGNLVPIITEVSGQVAGQMVKPVAKAVTRMGQRERF